MSSSSLLHLIIPNDCSGDRFDRALKIALERVEMIPPPSTKQVKRWIDQGLVTVLGQDRCRPSDRVTGGEQVHIETHAFQKRATHHRIVHESTVERSKSEKRAAFWNAVWERSKERDITPAEIIYLDEALVVLEKTNSVPTAPTLDPQRETLYHQALKALVATNEREDLNLQMIPYLRVIHRLDRDTSGLVVMARTATAAHILSEQFSSRDVDKRYIVKCLRPRSGPLAHYLDHYECGVSSTAAPFCYEAHMSRAPKDLGTQHSQKERWAVVQSGGVYSRTDFMVISLSADEALLEARLYTGRTHQIRVHLASLQAPIIGDQLYQREAHQRVSLHLHARQLSFKHPITKRGLHFVSHHPLGDFNLRD